ncbi:MAG: YnbE family lipoprotein [Proteobacteria bacterium]|nr:YnbE family lipoprotein [Pseudomonadota bacterium]
MRLKEFLSLAVVSTALISCTHKVQIEPSDKPFLVNLNLKIDHEIKMKIEQDNEDLLNLEKNVGKRKKG